MNSICPCHEACQMCFAKTIVDSLCFSGNSWSHRLPDWRCPLHHLQVRLIKPQHRLRHCASAATPGSHHSRIQGCMARKERGFNGSLASDNANGFEKSSKVAQTGPPLASHHGGGKLRLLTLSRSFGLGFEEVVL
jgi:hypothetical protein